MDQRVKSVLIQVIAALLIILAIIGLEFLGDNIVLFYVFVTLAIAAVVIFIAGLVLERRGGNKKKVD
jgi:hypothetical protein